MELTLELSDCLANWIDKKMKELGGIRNIKIIFSDPLPFEWLPGNRNSIQGITFWYNIYLRKSFYPIDLKDENMIELILHELVHVEQFRRNPLQFPGSYLIKYLYYGYWEHPAEVEARNRSRQLLLEYLSEDPCNCLNKEENL
jgi:hypothetical protein